MAVQTNQITLISRCHRDLFWRQSIFISFIEGIDSDASSKYPSDLALYVGEAKFSPTDVDPATGFRYKVKVPFRREIPLNRSYISMTYDVLYRMSPT